MAANLPRELTSFIGREPQIAEIKHRLSSARLLTLTGPGGCGKTRLALQVASELAGHFPDGVFFVSLSSISSPDLVAPSIAQALGVKEVSGRPPAETLLHFLPDRHLLLVLDNFEHLVEAAPLVARLLAEAPGLKVLVTSRECLHVRGEQEFPVPPLSLPAASAHDPRPPSADVPALMRSEAVRLFADRASAVEPDFELTPENAMAVARICHRLDGLPLAIELAAARSKSLSAPAMLARLDSPLNLLTGGARDLPARQQTLRSAIGWSYNLLNPEEQSLFRALSVFAGGFPLDAASAVMAQNSPAPAALDLVSSLVDKSLLARDPRGNEPRFKMLETIREFALERLSERGDGQAEEVRSRHAAYYLVLAERAEPALQGKSQLEWLNRLEPEHDNLRVALAWSLERGDAATALRLTGALGWFWSLRGYFSEGGSWLDSALSLQGSQQPTGERAKALNWASLLAYRQSDSAKVRSLLEESVSIWRELGDPGGLAYALTLLGVVVLYQGEHERARALLEESVAEFRRTTDRWGLALSLRNLAEAANATGDDEERRALLEESAAIFRQEGDKWGLALALNNLGEVARSRREYRQAATLYDESISLHRQLDRHGATTLRAPATSSVEREADDYGHAAQLFHESLALFQELGDRQGVAWCLAELAGVAAAQHKPERAACLFGASQSLLDAVNAQLDAVDRAQYDRTLASTRTLLGDARFQAAWSQGNAMSLDEAIAFASDDLPRSPVANPREALPELLKVAVPSSANPAGLTPRELEVLRCLALGLTDIQAARQLSMSPRTFQAHVRSIFGKLGVTTRGAAARFGTDHGLV
ncbi:MAG: tetratricopeptide repeat protein [Chloroflexia bacterium]